jgi:hypothetical protein
MSLPSPDPPSGPRMSRGIKLVLMGVAGAALLYSCSPGIGAGLGALPYLWFFSNPFYRPPAATPCPPGAPDCQQASTSSGGGSGGYTGRGGTGGSTSNTANATSSESTRGGFGATGSHGALSGAS